jgi:hypothetical protein
MAVFAAAVGAALLPAAAAGTFGAALLGGAVIGAGVGGLYSAVTGDGDILNSMLTGGLIGGAAGGISGAMAAPTVAPTATGLGAPGSAATTVNTVTAAEKAAEAAALLDAAAVAEGGTTAGMATEYAAQEAAKAAAQKTAEELAKKAALEKGKSMLGYGLAGTAAMQLLGGKEKGANAPTDPGMIRPYTFSSNPTPATGNFPSPYATAQYDAAGMPIMDTRERNYFDQKYAALTPYSAKPGTVNPNFPVAAAKGGLMAAGGPVEEMSRYVMRGQGNMFPQSQQEHTNFATPTQMPTSAEVIRSDYDARTEPYSGVMMAGGGIARFADKGMVDEEAELRKIVMNNLKKLSPEQMQNVMGFMDKKETEQDFLMKHMPNYAESMRPTISGMVEEAQYGDRMSKSFIDKARENALKSGNDFQEPSQNYARITPTMVNPESGMYGGIASIGRQVDPNTRVNMMADLQRTPYDRNALDAVRRVGAGVDRRIGKDANLSAYYEQDPMGRNKAGGVRYTQNFSVGGVSYDPKNQTYSGTGIAQASAAPAVTLPPLAADLVASLTPQYQAANPYKYAYDPKKQRYSAATPDMNQLHAFKALQDQKAEEEAAAQAYQPYGGGGAAGGLMPYDLGGYSDGGRLLRGPGDGVSDDIPATIAGKQPARLADGEFVIPARIVSELGNGSTDAGAKRLYAMMDRIQDGRKKTIGKKNIAKDTKAKKHLLA